MKKPPVPQGREYEYDWDNPDEVDLRAAPSVPPVFKRPDDPENATGDQALRHDIEDFPKPRQRGPLRDYAHDERYAALNRLSDSDRRTLGYAILVLLSAVGFAVAMAVSQDDSSQDSSWKYEHSSNLLPNGDPDASSGSDAGSIVLAADVSPVDTSVSFLREKTVQKISLHKKNPVGKISPTANLAKQRADELEEKAVSGKPMTPEEIQQLNEQRILTSQEEGVLFKAAEEERKRLEQEKAKEEGKPTDGDWL